MSTVGPSFLTGPFQRRQIPGNANSGRGSSPFSENQCHVAGLRPSCGSQNDDAGIRQRRCSKLSFQKRLEILSSRVLVTRFGARSSCSSTKPQESKRDFALTVVSFAHDRSRPTRKDLRQRIDGGDAVVRDAEQPADRVAVAGHGIEVAHGPFERESPEEVKPRIPTFHWQSFEGVRGAIQHVATNHTDFHRLQRATSGMPIGHLAGRPATAPGWPRARRGI